MAETAASVLLALTCATPSVDARPVQVDFDEAPFPNSGAGWPDAFDDAVDATASTAGGTLAFSILLGSNTYDSFCLSEDGFVGFQIGSTSCAGTDPAAYSDAVFSVLFDPNLESIFDGFATSPGSVSYSVGFADLTPPFVRDEAVTAMRFFWNDLDSGGENRIFQMFMYDVGNGNGDFDLEFTYGLGDDSYATGTQSLVVNGASIATGVGPFVPATDYYFRFRAGGLGAGPPVPVPEPGTLMLMLSGLGALALARRRHRPGS